MLWPAGNRYITGQVLIVDGGRSPCSEASYPPDGIALYAEFTKGVGSESRIRARGSPKNGWWCSLAIAPHSSLPSPQKVTKDE